MLVSDGSVRHSPGTFRWGKDKGWVPGNNATTSYRAEAQGITDGLFSGPVPPNLQAYLDNKSVVHQLNRNWPLNPLQPEWELLEPTRQLVKQHKLTIHHVKGHQDLKHPHTTQEAHLNHQAD